MSGVCRANLPTHAIMKLTFNEENMVLHCDPIAVVLLRI